MDLAIPFTVGCIIICAIITYNSYKNKNRGVIDGGAQTVVTIGVLFTFIGIAIALYNFDPNTEKMSEQINYFLSGMKTAFWTSIAGMIFGIIIKFFQSGVEQNEDAFIKKNISTMELTNNAVQRNTDTLSTALNEIKTILVANSNTALQLELSKLVNAMKTFVDSSEESRADMENFSNNMTEQSKMLEKLSKTLTKSIQDFGDIQSKGLQILSEKIVQSSENQAAQLDKMNENINEMRKSTDTAQKNSAELLSESKNYQQKSLSNDDIQMQILKDNTDKIADMRISFDKFLNDMAENYSNELINALNKSMEKLNTQLQTQFGENFRELNAAVREVVTWQRQYKEIVITTTEELQTINKVFTDFTQTISVNIENQIAALTENLKTFADTSNKNVAIQKNLNDAVEQTKVSVQTMQNITDNFGEFSKNILKANDDALKAYGSTITENFATISDSMEKLEKSHHKQVENNLQAVNAAVQKFADDIKQLQNVALTFTTDTSHYLRDFRTVSDNVMLEIRGVLEKFNSDFSTETKKSVENLDKIFKEIGKNTDKQSDKAIKNLAGALSAINNQMVINYNALIKKLAELDAVLNERRRV